MLQTETCVYVTAADKHFKLIAIPRGEAIWGEHLHKVTSAREICVC